MNTSISARSLRLPISAAYRKPTPSRSKSCARSITHRGNFDRGMDIDGPIERALEQARALGAVIRPRAALRHPIRHQDNMDLLALPTTAGCPAFAYTPDESAFRVERLMSAGAILIGKTNLDQFATGLVGTRSPTARAATRSTRIILAGGSGSAVAVARPCEFSLGKIRRIRARPAAFNNLIGMKPS